MVGGCFIRVRFRTFIFTISGNSFSGQHFLEEHHSKLIKVYLFETEKMGKYAAEPDNATKAAKARGSNLRVHFKVCMKITM